jgi:hypothetical protein
VEVIQPVYERLMQSGLSTLLLCHNPGAHACIQSRVHDAQLLSFETPNASYRSNRACRSVLDLSRDTTPKRIQGKTLRFETLIRDSLQHWYGLYNSTRDLTEEVLERVRPQGILVGNDVSLAGRLTCRLAQRRGIPTFAIMHGSVDSDAWKHGLASKFFVFGQSDREQLVRAGVAQGRLIVAGSSKLEAALSRLQPVYLPKQGYERCVLVAFSGPGHLVSRDHHERLVDCVTGVVRKFPRVLFVPKLHRKDSPRFYSQFARLPNTLLVSYTDASYPAGIYDWLGTADALITATSTSAIDAMAMGKPAVTLDLTGEFGQVSFISEGATLHCQTAEALEQALSSIVTGEWDKSSQAEHQRQYAEYRFAKPRGGAARKIAEEICSTIESASTG